LLLVHGFTSSIEESYSRRIDWVRELGANYDTVLGYSHPTIGTDVETNVQALLAFIPDDVQLQVDLICHSRGGLVGRSLIELFPSPKLQVERAVFCGSPHAGTVLADPERWDQLVGLMTNGATLAATLAGGGALGIIPKALGWVLRAAAQFASDLPGVMVMRPKGNAFLDRLNAAHVGGGLPQTRYAVAAARYSVFNPVQQSFSQMLKALAAQAFIDKPNDLVVPTASMSSIDLPQRMQLGNRVFDTAVTHFGYFDDPKVRAFIVEQLRR
jgi:pimeloyl-ACP methyl ester carboxylesterase